MNISEANNVMTVIRYLADPQPAGKDTAASALTVLQIRAYSALGAGTSYDLDTMKEILP